MNHLRGSLFGTLGVLVVVLASRSPGAIAQERPQDVLISSPTGAGHRLVGKLREPLGTVLKVQGTVVGGPFKGGDGGPNLRVSRINGQATQEHIQIPLIPYFEEFGQNPRLPKLKYRETYEFEGYETGQFMGIPDEAYRRLQLDGGSFGFRFRHSFLVYRGRQIAPIIWSPADFVDRTATISGSAESADNQAYVVGQDWRLLADAKAPWPVDIVGKLVEATGTIRQTDHPKTFRLDAGASQLARLEDQVGRQVLLRGTVDDDGTYWWLNYRGIDIFLGDRKTLSDWPAELQFKTASISGILDEGMISATMRHYRPITTKQFFIRNPAWKRIDGLKSFEIDNRPPR